MRGPPPRTPPHKGEGKWQAFLAIIQMVGAHTLPPVGRVGRASGRGGGRGMLIVGASSSEPPAHQSLMTSAQNTLYFVPGAKALAMPMRRILPFSRFSLWGRELRQPEMASASV